MKNIYRETISICPLCAKDSPAYYEILDEGIFLELDCAEHGHFSSQAERDVDFFIKGYEEDYKKDGKHLVFPITYRCNLECRYCYTLSNVPGAVTPVPDRSFDDVVDRIKSYNGYVSLIGGEPTVRDDLMEIIRSAREIMGTRKLSLCTNAQKLADIGYVRKLKESGLDFVYLSFNDLSYEPSEEAHRNKLRALDNCLKLSMPVWLQRTVSKIDQLASLPEIVEKYRKAVFFMTIRAVSPFGLRYPEYGVFVSDMVKFFDQENDYTKGSKPFNRHIKLKGRSVKLCSWVEDMKRMDQIDSDYITADDAMTTFHRGLKEDEVFLLKRAGKSVDLTERYGSLG